MLQLSQYFAVSVRVEERKEHGPRERSQGRENFPCDSDIDTDIRINFYRICGTVKVIYKLYRRSFRMMDIIVLDATLNLPHNR